MAVCKECIHYDVCNSHHPRSMKDRIKLGNGYTCDHFKNKADFAEVVRCKKCIYWEKGKDYTSYCNDFDGLTEPDADGYCYFGVRKGNPNG